MQLCTSQDVWNHFTPLNVAMSVRNCYAHVCSILKIATSTNYFPGFLELVQTEPVFRNFILREIFLHPDTTMSSDEYWLMYSFQLNCEFLFRFVGMPEWVDDYVLDLN